MSCPTSSSSVGPEVEIEARIVRLQLAETFVIARDATDYADVVHVALSHEEATGYGEAAPVERYDESAESAVRFVQEHGELVGDDPFALEEIGARLTARPGEQAAKAAIDAALHDLQGKLLDFPAHRLLGLPRHGPPTSWTVWLGDPDDMARRAEKAAPSYRRLKLKLGGGDGLDVERVRSVRGVTELPLQVDVNEAWSFDEAVDSLPELAELGVEYCEQPLRAGDESGGALKDRSPLPIYVDEDCHVLADVESCARIAHGINIKLAKSGGIREAVRMAHAARALALGVMLGCMLESGLGIAAGVLRRPALRPRRPGRQPAPARGPLPRRRARGRSPGSGGSSRPGRLGSSAVSTEPRRLLILGEGFSHDAHYGKTMRGIIRYGPDPVVAILDSARAGEAHEGIPIVGTVEDALPFGPTVAVVGVATQGGRFPPAWRELLKSSIANGLDVESGLHEFVSEDPELIDLAGRHGVELRDLRRPPTGLSVPTGANLEVDARIVLTVGSDCAIGKKTVAVELDLEARRRGLESVFVPTGQTGIAIAGWGIAVDAVVADFLAGAAERLVVEGAARGGKLLFVEGQGSLVHPLYSGVTLGLVHGSAPHAFVLCHRAGATEIDGSPGHPIPPLAELVELHERMSLPRRRAKVVCIALNTADIDDDEDARAAIEAAAAETGLPADDPVRFGAGPLLDAVLARI